MDAVDAAGNRSGRTDLTTSTAACTTPPPPPATCSKVASPGQGTAQALLDSLGSGQVGCLRGGTYTASGSYVLYLTASNRTIISYPGERARLRGNIAVMSGANGNRLAGLDIEGTGSGNTIEVLAADFVLEDSDITNVWRGQSCIILGIDGWGTAVRPVIRRNKFHECGIKGNHFTHGIYAGHLVDGKITDNVIWNVGGFAIQLYPNAQNTLFAHNIIDGSGASDGGLIFGGGDGNFASETTSSSST